MKAALYARVSTLDQEPENQLVELRRYAAARGWEISEYVDHGVSGSEDRRKALDALVGDVRRRRVEKEDRLTLPGESSMARMSILVARAVLSCVGCGTYSGIPPVGTPSGGAGYHPGPQFK